MVSNMENYFERNDDFVNRHVVLYKDLLGVVIEGAFASDAWIDLDPCRTITGRVEVIWSDDNHMAVIDRGQITRVATVAELDTLIASGRYQVTEEFKLFVNESSKIKVRFFGIAIDDED